MCEDFSIGLKLGITLVMLTAGLALVVVVMALDELGVLDMIVQFVKLHRNTILQRIGWLLLTAYAYYKVHKEETQQ